MINEVKKNTFHKSKYPIDINEVDIDEIVISAKVLYGEKSLRNFGYKDNEKVKSLRIMLLKMARCVDALMKLICVILN